MRTTAPRATTVIACLGALASAHGPAAAERAPQAALKDAGHRVILVAPAANASGTSASFTSGKAHVVRDPSDPSVFGVGASPATAVVLGAAALYPAGRRPGNPRPCQAITCNRSPATSCDWSARRAAGSAIEGR